MTSTTSRRGRVFRCGARVGWIGIAWPLASIEVAPDTITVKALFHREVARKAAGDSVEFRSAWALANHFRLWFADGQPGEILVSALDPGVIYEEMTARGWWVHGPPVGRP